MHRACALVIVTLLMLTGCALRSSDDTVNEVATSTPGREPAPQSTATANADVSSTETMRPTTVSTSTSPPVVTTVAPHADRPRSTRLAYFHIAPVTGEPPDVLAEHANFISLTYGDERYRDDLRDAGYDGSILQFVVASEVNGPGPYIDGSEACDGDFRPLRNGIAREQGEFCRDIHPNEDWFLHNGAGERLYTVVGTTGVWYHMNPGNPGWQSYALEKLERDLIGPESLGFNGIFLDNVELSIVRVSEQMTNSDGVVREFNGNSAYRSAWIEYVTTLSERLRPGGEIWANMVSDPNDGRNWTPFLEQLDGAMLPAFATGYHGLTPARWANNLTQIEAALVSGTRVVAVAIGERTDDVLQQFALASYLLVTDGENVFFRYVSSDNPEDVSSFWLYENYAVTLGEPMGPRFRSGQTWRRNFECGYVEVEPANRTASIVQTECGAGQ